MISFSGHMTKKPAATARKGSRFRALAAALCGFALFAGSVSPVHALTVKERLAELPQMTIDERLAAHRAMAVQSNEVPGWPTGPAIGAESAILMDADTGTILYSKNIHLPQYPASTTKLMTALLVSERCKLDEVVTFSRKAVFDTPRDSSHIAMDVGQQLTIDQCLQAILIRSANEVSYAVAEYITGSTDWLVFADIMNARAKELGCLGTHFRNPNGLPDEDHYTTAYDLAMIGKAFFANKMLCQITLTRRMEFPATDRLPLGKLENNHMQIIPGSEYGYEYLVGCKTGYTDDARNSLVSCAEKNGLKLICVVLRDEMPYQYEDTIALFEYGFANFAKVNVSQAETKYNIDNAGMFYSGDDIFGNSRPLLSLNRNDSILLPKTVSLENLEAAVSYSDSGDGHAVVLSYSYRGVSLGTVRVDFAAQQTATPAPDSPSAEDAEPQPDASLVIVNVKVVLLAIAALAVIWFALVLVRAVLRNYAFAGRQCKRRRQQRPRRQRRDRHGDSLS